MSVEQARVLRGVLGRTSVKVNQDIGTDAIYRALADAGIEPDSKAKNYKIVEQAQVGW